MAYLFFLFIHSKEEKTLPNLEVSIKVFQSVPTPKRRSNRALGTATVLVMKVNK